MSDMGQLTWPEVLVTGKIPDRYKELPELKMKLSLIADGLCGWGCCVLEKPPAKFGEGMVEIQQVVGVCTAEALKEKGDELLKQYKEQEAKNKEL